ncbi:MAG: FAD:protein FMN transferase [Caldilineae bacterium]|nr:MAG: FAD:protein FMN transferase [Caldilineae bacterium]
MNRLYSHHFRAMNCTMSAWVYSDTNEAQIALRSVEEWMQEVEARLSRFRPDSELSRLNAAAGRPFRADPLLWDVTQEALAAAERTNGIFDPTVGQALIAAGYDRSFEQLDTRSTAAPLALSEAQAQHWRQIGLDRKEHLITLPEGVRLDLGGIAKGWAADRALEILAPYGPALIDAGGDLAFGDPPPLESGWQVGIADPLWPDDDLVNLTLARGGLATSGTDFRRWRRNGRLMHHLIDPGSAGPAETEILSASVIAPTATEADVLALVLVVLGRQRAEAWLESQPWIPALIVLNDGRTYQTEPFKRYVNAYYPSYRTNRTPA